MKRRKKKLFNRDLILEKLAEVGEVTAEYLLNLVCNLPAVFDRRVSMQSFPRHTITVDFRTMMAWRSMLYKLRKEGLIYQVKGDKVKVAKEGVEYISNNPSWLKSYKAARNKNPQEVILIVFDIPERMRVKRDWLRFQLENLDYSPLQRSVWYGNNILPDNFLEDLKRYDLLPHVHILSVNKKGSISNWLSRIGKRDLAL